MFFILSKVLFFFFLPSNLLWLLLVAGLICSLRGTKRLGGRLMSVAVVALLIIGYSPLGNWLSYPLEQRFARPANIAATPQALGPVSGIIVLGGYEDGRVTAGRGLLSVNEAGERMIETIRLAHVLPKSRLIFSGGDGRLVPHEDGATAAIGRTLSEVGVAASRIMFENRSRTTYENAIFTHDLVRPKPGERFLLVTSAWHMPRAMATFRQAGFDVLAWPVDYRTRDASDLLRVFDSLPNGLERVDMATKEWIGLIAYRLSGRSNAMWPAP